jgi:hypothetical protein
MDYHNQFRVIRSHGKLEGMDEFVLLIISVWKRIDA